MTRFYCNLILPLQAEGLISRPQWSIVSANWRITSAGRLSADTFLHDPIYPIFWMRPFWDCHQYDANPSGITPASFVTVLASLSNFVSWTPVSALPTRLRFDGHADPVYVLGHNQGHHITGNPIPLDQSLQVQSVCDSTARIIGRHHVIDAQSRSSILLPHGLCGAGLLHVWESEIRMFECSCFRFGISEHFR